MTIMEKAEVYGYYFMDIATEEEVAEYWEAVDSSPEYANYLIQQGEEILSCAH